ncbi:MAG: proteasome assembly chaperone (PAC2) family protein [Lentimonas sp.]|jgi:proteasome assembly chaperone (PAC2) family protein
MQLNSRLKDPWMVAVWPGMGAVSLSAGYYLMAKLGMRLVEEFPAKDFFELSSVEVRQGLIMGGKLPRSRLFLWRDPNGRHDLVVFIGEAQPAAKGTDFCKQLIDLANKMGVRSVFTFAAMATDMRPEQPSHVFGAAIDRDNLSNFKERKVELLESGQISGLNGVLLSLAADRGFRGGCLLGEMPHTFPQFPFPKASLAVLKVFSSLSGIEVDFTELKNQAREVELGLEQFLRNIESSMQDPKQLPPPESRQLPGPPLPLAEKPRLGPYEKARIEQLFEGARADRSRAYVLKQELDRLKVFHKYEDRFLDLFKES